MHDLGLFVCGSSRSAFSVEGLFAIFFGGEFGAVLMRPLLHEGLQFGVTLRVGLFLKLDPRN